jgi:hypothetical protein
VLTNLPVHSSSPNYWGICTSSTSRDDGSETVVRILTSPNVFSRSVSRSRPVRLAASHARTRRLPNHITAPGMRAADHTHSMGPPLTAAGPRRARTDQLDGKIATDVRTAAP